MKLILISDSHGNRDGIDKIFSTKKFDYLFFMGDGLNDLGLYYVMNNVFAVSGNCDFFSKVENEKFVDLNGKKIFITHGNKYGVKSNLNQLIDKANDIGADFVFYGHTHKQKAEKIGETYFINPGSFHKNSFGKSIGLEIVIDKDIKIKQFEIE